MQSILYGETLGTTHMAEGHNPSKVEGDHNVEKEGHVAAECIQVEMHMTDWSTAQKEDPVVNANGELVRGPEEDQSEDTPGRAWFSQQRELNGVDHQNFTTLQNALYLCSTPEERMRIYYSLWPQWCIELPL